MGAGAASDSALAQFSKDERLRLIRDHQRTSEARDAISLSYENDTEHRDRCVRACVRACLYTCAYACDVYVRVGVSCTRGALALTKANRVQC